MRSGNVKLHVALPNVIQLGTVKAFIRGLGQILVSSVIKVLHF